MFRPQFSLRTLTGTLTVAALLLGIGVPSYRWYQHYLLVREISGLVKDALTDVESQMLENPESAKCDVDSQRLCSKNRSQTIGAMYSCGARGDASFSTQVPSTEYALQFAGRFANPAADL